MSNQFCVNKYTDTDLLREEWIHYYYDRACHRAAIEVIGKTVVVAVIRNGSIYMEKTQLVKGDVFDMETGVAVAYCKALGLRVPDFI